MPVRPSLGVALQLAERLDRVHREPHPVCARAHLPAEPGSLRGRDLADVPGALDQQDVGLPGARQAVRDSEADRAAPDDDDLALGQRLHAALGLYAAWRSRDASSRCAFAMASKFSYMRGSPVSSLHARA